MRITKYFYNKEFYGRVYFVGICDDNGVTSFSRYLGRETYRNVNILNKNSVVKVFKEANNEKAVKFIEENWDKLFEGTIKSKIKEKEIEIEECKNRIKWLEHSVAKLKALKAK